MQKKIVAGIVLFNPDTGRFNECLSRLQSQVEKIYIFDNSDTVSNCNFVNIGSVIYISENKNCGIAYALNQIMERAKIDGYQWVITMDQDSLIPDKMLKDFSNVISSIPQIGIVCPQVIDRRRTYQIAKKSETTEYIETCITSASCTSVEAWEKCGKFDEWMFIDLVDNDFCKRLILSDYKILKLNKWVLDQEFGQIIPKSYKKQKFWIELSKVFRNKNIAKLSYKKKVSPSRVYYTNRNIIYLNKKMKKYGKVGYENYNCSGYAGFVFCFLIPSIIRAQDKRQVIRATLRGIIDGCNSHPSEWKKKEA